MDNMLYIIAGLVLILIVAVLVMRKNKAQKPSDQPSINTDRTDSLSTQTASKDMPDKASSNNERKFDHIEIAQRFMDQQRYDKAIETLNRGLIEKPHDNQLSLKLLAVYATIDQSDNFNKVYDSIKAHNDVKSIAQADELKALLTEEQNQIAQQSLPADNSQDAGFESIDFDMLANKVENNAPTFDTATAQPVEYENDLLNATNETLTVSNDFDSFNNFNNIEQTFDLSQNNLENNTIVTPVTTLDIADEEALVSSTTVTDTDSNDFDFDFDFELSEESDISTESPVTAIANDNLNDITLDEEDFFLDLADLEIDAEADNVSVDDQITTDAIQTNEDGLTLSLDGIDSIDASNATENQTAIEQPIVIEDSFDDFNIEGDLGESHSFEDNKTEVSSISPTTVMFDDNTLIDDDFDFDTLSNSPTATTPVAVESDHDVSGIDYSDTGITAETTIETAEDFSSRFAADFDFVKTLDSNQVTLDLAGQYVQLGEYDSAKRLLNEVLTQGNSEQQQQAQLLLERTA
ncbi:FimV/HubP family polar landmark protein [Psychrobacter sp. DAB_AL62B]|uniref:FimV/HubP family polar landmark protein n=1 Tax=Psychrobacter sp. DAB_AL62B TaxID=1028420 RepID=UPI0023813F79|nr:FimV/HubP family polar landmark protein [Psychrobacter sp. DAB_AL62B]MDE4456094.1 pilus assembly protein FimV [Psychrobacter sp. DAB_AL62B]